MSKTDRANIGAAHTLAETFRHYGVARLFGIPGGGSSLDLIAGAKATGLPFTLVRHETAGVIMAGVTADITGTPGAMLVTKGPGVANAINGLACADLERSPVFLVADAITTAEFAYVTHQAFDQMAVAAPLTRARVRSSGAGIREETARLAAAATTAPQGPVLLELDGEAARMPTTRHALPALPRPPDANEDAIAVARAHLARAHRPVVIAGMEARTPSACAALRAFVAALGCPALVTYKAKGVIPDDDPHYAGIFTGGVAEKPILAQADLVILAGADPVEFIPQPWVYKADVIDIALFARGVHYMTPAASCIGDIATTLARLTAGATRSEWPEGIIVRHRSAVLGALACPGNDAAIGPERIVRMAAAACARHGIDARTSVDAGAHMFSATTFWPCARPHDLLISNGLATMGFALPAAIAAALVDPHRPVIAFTGDGGLAMCLGELATACAAGARIVVVVFNDDGLSLIAAKTGGRDLPADSLRWQHGDFAACMRAFGGSGYTVRSAAEYDAALDGALLGNAPALIDVRLDPAGYAAQLRALRG